ncbi:hypothetical protein GCM10023188_45000 [Pontibacter saemangeumensis]|uniref:PKD-like domain-containing protein n=1 Tax=Pontibacter saemangeumensis TaxID=1084525 RepID=A0ABP8M5P8_9BACT
MAGFTELEPIELEENDLDDFSEGDGAIMITAPTGWAFRQSGVTTNVSPDTEITVDDGDISYTLTTISIPFSVGGTDASDKFTISGVALQAQSGEVLPASDVLLAVTGIEITGITSPIPVANIAQTHGAPTQLAFISQPEEVQANESFNPVVEVQDWYGNTVTSASGNVSLSLTGTPATALISSGGTVASVTNGIAQFNNIVIDEGGQFQLVASYGPAIQGASSPFVVNNEVPSVTEVTPCITAGSNVSTITVTGTDFIRGSVVSIGDEKRDFIFIDSQTLSVSLLPEDVDDAQTLILTVFNPEPGGGLSNAIDVVVQPVYNAGTITGDVAVCENTQNVTYSVDDIGAEAYSWTVGAGATYQQSENGNSITVDFGSTAPTVNISVKAINSCIVIGSTSELEVAVTPYPVNVNAGADQTICSGKEVALGSEAPAVAGYVYEWSPANADSPANALSSTSVPNPTLTLPVNNTAQTLFYAYELTVTNGNSDCQVTDEILVGVYPAVVTVADDVEPVCEGGVIELRTTGDPAYTYAWTGPNGFKSAERFPVIENATLANAGAYTVEITNQNGCTGTDNINVTVVSPPTANAGDDQAKCAEGATTSFALAGIATGGGGVWNVVAGTGTAVITNPASLTPTVSVSSASVTLQFTVTNGAGCKDTDQVVLTVKQPTPVTISSPTNGATYYTAGNSVALTASQAGGTFSGKGVSGSVAAGFTFSPCAAGAGKHSITYTYINAAGCTSTAQAQVTVVQSTYTVIITAAPFPICKGQNTTYTARVYRDAVVIYPYKENPALITKTNTTTTYNEAYDPYLPAGWQPIHKQFPARYFQPVVLSGVEQPVGDFNYQWTKNEANSIGSDRDYFGQAGLSSTDYFKVYVTQKKNVSCVTTITRQLSNPMFIAEPAGYQMTITAAPNTICKGASTVFTAFLDSAFPWAASNLNMTWRLSRGGTIYDIKTVSGVSTLTAVPNGYNAYLSSAEIKTALGAAGAADTDLVNGDQVFVEFSTDIEKIGTEKCKEKQTSVQPVVMTVNQPVTTTTNPQLQSQAVCAGGTATFNVNVSGTAPLSYIWTMGGTTKTTTTPTVSFSGAETGAAGTYPVSVSVSNSCSPAGLGINLGNLTIRNLTTFAMTGSGEYCANVPESIPVGLTGSEQGVNYTLMRGTDVVETKPGTGGALEFTAQTTEGTYTVIAAYATAPACSEPMGGSATITITEPATTFGDLKVTWVDDEMTQWEVEALQYAESYGDNPAYLWYEGATNAAGELEWIRRADLSGNPVIVDVNNPELLLMVEVLRTDAVECSKFVLTNEDVVPLPVEIIYLNASKQGNNVLLEWATAMEQDNAGFEVQVSTDGFTYRKLTFVPAKNGNASTRQEYEFTDKENGKFGTRYYRLKQLDTNGTHEYFGPKAVSFGSVASQVIAFPNPFHDEVTLDIASETAGEALITVTDAVGKQLLVRKVQVEKGFTTEKLRLDAGLPRGLYIIKAQVGGVTQYIKMIKE